MTADRWGIERRYVDATGQERTVAQEAVEELRRVIGRPPEGAGGSSVVVRGGRKRLGPGELSLEDGGSLAVTDRLPDEVPSGYHTFTDRQGRSSPLVVSPGRCHLPPRWRAWGWSCQLYATRSRRSWGIGDLSDLARLGNWARSLGAGFVLVNPLGAVAPAVPQQPSPYFPASRRFHNPLYLAVEEVAGSGGLPREVAEEVAAAAAAARRANAERQLDRDEAWRHKRRALEALWAAGSVPEEFTRWRREQPGALEEFACWSVLAERHGPRWRSWPQDCRSPEGAGVKRVAREDPERVGYHAWLQWLLADQLSQASQALPLVHDLPIGVDPEGFDAWAWQDVFASGVSVGAPPDEFNRRGQDWGLPPFVPWRLAAAGYAPFVETLRAILSLGGGLRIDHVMGLFRLWWIPSGAEPAEGAYVRYPARDLLRLLALESERHQALVVGEDLGTVEESARELLRRHDVLSYRLLWFEEEPPASWPARAMAAVTTHDLPTVAGLWTGSDLAEQEACGVEPNVESTEAVRQRLAAGGALSEEAPPEVAVAAAYRLLAEAPCTLLGATLEDALAEPRRPNIPGAERAANWSLALPVPLEELETHPLVTTVAETLRGALAPEPPRREESP